MDIKDDDDMSNAHSESGENQAVVTRQNCSLGQASMKAGPYTIDHLKILHSF